MKEINQFSWKQYFPEPMASYLEKSGVKISKVQEIRIRAERPVCIYYGNKEVFLTKQESEENLCCESEQKPEQNSVQKPEQNSAQKPKQNSAQKLNAFYCPSREMVEKILQYMSEFSVYAYEEEIRQGFITLQGGHRLGITGKVVIENAAVKTFQYINGLNLRIAHEIQGAANEVIQYLVQNGQLFNTLIISPPGFGKTTLLRDLIRQISDGCKECSGMTTAVVDERSEIGGCYHGVPQMNLGVRTDILDACPKAEGMMMMIRSMNPKVIAVDELGGKEDTQAVRKALRSGLKVIGTAHGESVKDIEENPNLRALIQEHIFDRYVMIQKQNGERTTRIYDKNMDLVKRKNRE